MGISYASGTVPFPSDTIWDLTAKLLLATTGGGGGGSAGKQIYSGVGSPEGVVTPTYAGDVVYLDLGPDGRIWWHTNGLLVNTGWI